MKRLQSALRGGFLHAEALFNRALTIDEVTALHKTPGLLSSKR